jgi:hypothetical protein
MDDHLQLEHIVGSTAFGEGGFSVWGCFSLNCKIDLYVIDGTLRGQKYRDTKPCAVKTSIDGPSANASVDNSSASQRVCSAEWLLSGEPFKESIFSWSHFQRPFCPLAFFYTPDLVHTLLQSNNLKWKIFFTSRFFPVRIYMSYT